MIEKLLGARTTATVIVTLMLTAGVAVAATSGGSNPTLAQEVTSTSVGDSTTSSAVGDSTTSTSVDESTTTSSPSDVTTTSAPVDQSTTTTEAGGGSGDFKNHGDCVSAAAHDTPPGAGHGQAVSEVAKSDCGKDSATTDGSEPESPESTEPSGSSHDDGSSNANGHSNGHGHSGS